MRRSLHRFGRIRTALLLGGLLAFSGRAHADRTVLAPNGDTLAPDTYRTEFLLDPQSRVQDRLWLQYSTPQGIELEAERQDLVGERKKGYSLNVQYPLTYSLISTLPSISVGVRDLTGTGNEHGAFYVAATKNVRLSDRQARYFRDLKIDLGAGTGQIGGLFIGVQTRLATGLSIGAEIYMRRPNFTIALPIARHLEAKAYSLDSHLFYGFAFSLQR